MIALIKNNQHYSHNYVSVMYDDSNTLASIIKSSSHKKGINSIKSEICGLDWYSKRNSIELSYAVYKVSDSYINLNFKGLKVIDIPGECSYSNYKALIPTVIDHYCQVWGKESGNMWALHGDLSLVGNILFLDLDSPFFIDWEHFKNNAAPAGFDVLNCILELIYYEDFNNKDLLHLNLRHISKMINLLNNKKCLDVMFFQSPLLSMTSFMKANPHLWGDQISKFPVLKFSEYQVHYIDTCLNKILQGG